MSRQRLIWIKRTIRWSLVIVTVAYIITGFGITEFRTIESLTFGILTKPWAFKIHTNLEIPFITILAMHILLSPGLRVYGAVMKRVSVQLRRRLNSSEDA
jgi:cytochrome b subunit of formate dehydrogenase